MSTEENDNLQDNSEEENSEAIVSASDAIELLKFNAATDIGRRREENQDSYGIIENDIFRFFIVADGMGGVQGGATASKMAVAIVEEYLKEKTIVTPEAICEAISIANKLIFEKGTEDANLSGMGTTFVGIVFLENRMFVVNVGDSRAYCFRNNRVLRLTEDHTLVMELVRSGTITEEQASNHPVSHMLTRSLGPTPEIEVDCYLSQECPLPNDRFLLCSDGLYNMVAESEMLDIISQNNIERSCEMLIELANQRGGTDNITIILIKTNPEFPTHLDIIKYAEQNSPHDLEFASLDPYADDENEEKEEIIFDPFAVPELDENVIKMRRTPPEAEKVNTENKKEDSANDYKKEEDLKNNTAEAEKKEQTDVDSVPTIKEDEQPYQRSTQAVVLTGVMAGIIGGVIVMLISKILFFSQPATNNVSTDKTQPKEEPVYQVPVPKIPNIPKNDTFILSMRNDLEKNSPNDLPAKSDIQTEVKNYYKENLEYRKEKLLRMITDVKLNLGRFENPDITEIQTVTGEEEKKLETISDELRQVRGEIDNLTRKLAIWYGRKTRIRDADTTNLASEVSVSSDEVKKKKEEFELASWNYLKEAEALRYMPADAEQRKKVDLLIEERNKKIKEMSEAVVLAIDTEIKDVEKQVTRYTLSREKLQDQLDYAERNIQYLNVLSSNNSDLKEKSKEELSNMLVSLESEFNEMKNILPAKIESKRESFSDFKQSEVKEENVNVN